MLFILPVLTDFICTGDSDAGSRGFRASVW